jgi:hypothetical protein
MAKPKKQHDPEALFKLAAGLNRSVPNPTEKPLDLIKEQIEKNKLFVGKGEQKVVADGNVLNTEGVKDFNLPDIKDMVPPIVIDGHKFRRTNIPTMDALTVLLYIVSTVLAKDDPRIADILEQVEFKLPDIEGNIIFPVKKTKKAKAKRRNDKPTK